RIQAFQKIRWGNQASETNLTIQQEATMQQIRRKAVRQCFERASRWPVHLLGMLVLTALVLAPCVMHAQIAGTANIQGTVNDSTVAVVASAGITLTDEATQVKRTTKSD